MARYVAPSIEAGSARLGEVDTLTLRSSIGRLQLFIAADVLCLFIAANVLCRISLESLESGAELGPYAALA
jgi:hypothetical protein